jgi:hypothetical protein
LMVKKNLKHINVKKLKYYQNSKLNFKNEKYR